jgi:hypothetical protein
MNFNLNSLYAASRHLASYVAGIITVALAWGLVSQTDAATLSDALTHITNGISEFSKAVGMIASVFVPIYTAWRSAHKATPNEQAKSAAENINQVTNGAKLAVINAVGTMPEVQKVITTKAVANATSSEKVVSNG